MCSYMHSFALSTETSRCKSKILSARSAARGVSAGAILSARHPKSKSSTEYDSDYLLPKDDIYEDTGDDLASDEKYGDSTGARSKVVVKIIKNGVEVSYTMYCRADTRTVGYTVYGVGQRLLSLQHYNVLHDYVIAYALLCPFI